MDLRLTKSGPVMLALALLLTLPAPGFGAPQQAEAPSPERMVVLLHGLFRSSTSMNRMERALDKAGFRTCNIDYPSTKHDIETLARDHVLPQIQACTAGEDVAVDFVTHSMGGILVRYLAAQRLLPGLGRVVMLSPPNQGSEIVDRWADIWLFDWLNGPAGRQLGTDSASLPSQLGPPDFEVGIITGSRSINPILSSFIPGKDDGKVSVERAKLEGMSGFLVLPAAHPFIMRNKSALAEAIRFLREGTFDEETR